MLPFLQEVTFNPDGLSITGAGQHPKVRTRLACAQCRVLGQLLVACDRLLPWLLVTCDRLCFASPLV